MIKDLRERTGAGMADCKKALTECAADMEKAIEYLRKKGIASAAKKATRIAAEGTVAQLHARRPHRRAGRGQLRDRLRGAQPRLPGVRQGDRDADRGAQPAVRLAGGDPGRRVEKEKAIRIEQAKTSGKPEAVIPKIVEGQLAKWAKEICLLDQVWVKDPEGKKDIRALLTELVAKTGENIKIRRFVRFEVGEGLEKSADDFVAEVQKQAGQA